MRGLLIVNPQATATSPRVTDVIVAALSAGSTRATDQELRIEVVRTQHRGHAGELGRQARRDGLDIVITLGGDGTINEVVNGMLGTDLTNPPAAHEVPMIATVPGGSANVFARALGLPVDPVEATGELLAAIAQRHTRLLGLGSVEITSPEDTLPTPRWFLANIGLGFDAEIIAAMETQRAAGVTATPGRYLRTTLRQFFAKTDRREPALTMRRAGNDTIDDIFLAIVQNTSPWTYLGPLAIDACPHASFDSDLDVCAIRKMGIATALRMSRRLLSGSLAGSTKRSISLWHDQRDFTITARRPTPIQVDGEGLGPVTVAHLRAHPVALRTVVPLPPVAASPMESD